jgi:hypothetical protein
MPAGRYGSTAALLEPSAVSHQEKKIRGDHEAAHEDDDENDQLSARPFHEAPQVLFPNARNSFASKVEGFELAFCDPIMDGPPGDAERLADLLDGIHPLHTIKSP